jgi:hypothetical protein
MPQPLVHRYPIEEEEEEFRVERPDVNEVSFRASPHHNVHCTLGADTRAIGPL